MSRIQTHIANKQRQKALEGSDLKEIILSTTETIVEQTLAKIRPEIEKTAQELATATVEKWTKGVQKGDRGDKGYTPQKGVDYFDGEDGKTPVAGIDFPIPENGKDGKSIVGSPGKPGKDGSPDNPEEIAEKINTLEEKINPKTIRNFEKIIRTLSENIKDARNLKLKGGGGSGGMGLPVHQSFALTSATTEVTVSQGIAANGLALFVYFQGQMVAKGVGYTVSGKTISLDFSPENGTYLDVIYFRG